MEMKILTTYGLIYVQLGSTIMMSYCTVGKFMVSGDPFSNISPL